MKQTILSRLIAALLMLACLVATFTGCAVVGSGNETTPVITTVPSTTAPDTTASGNGAGENGTTAQDTDADGTVSPDTSASDTTATDTSASDTTATDTSASDTTASDTTVPDTTVPDTTAPDTTAPDTSAPETTVPDTTAPDTTAPETEAPHVHSYTSTTVAPTCVDGGYTKHVCACGHSYVDNKKNAKGHSGSWTTTASPTCNDKGSKTRTCTVCGTVETESISANGHKWDSGVVTKEPASCSQQGTKTFTCKSCGATKTESVSGLHSFGPWQWEAYTFEQYTGDAWFDDFYGPATYTSHRKVRVCSKCGYREVEDYGDHICGLGSPNVTSKVLCDNCVEGKDTYYVCGICGWNYTKHEESLHHENIKKFHTYIDQTECTEMTHQIKTTCLDCGSVSYSYPIRPTWEQNYDPALGIDFVSIIVPDAYNPNPDPEGINWMITRRNIKYDSNGYITSFDIHWHDKDQNCKVATIVVADVKQAFIDWGYTFPEGSLRGVEIALYDGYCIPMRQTGTS